jgi:AcrR family transcriptional regulator
MIAAVEIFAEQGFHGSSTRQIAKDAGMSPAAVYQHYRSKEDLLYAITWTATKTLADRMESVATQPGSATERLSRLVSTHAAHNAALHTAARVANAELHSLRPKQRKGIVAIRDGIDALFDDCLREGSRSGEFTLTDLAMTRIALISLGIAVSRWYSPDGRLTPQEVGEIYAMLALRIVGIDT